MPEIAFRSAIELARLTRNKKIGCEELLDHMLARVKQHNGELNAVIATRVPAARKQARLADKQLAKRSFKPGPLFGVPITVKESFDVAGLPTTWGLPEFSKHRAKTHSAVVSKLIDAGANVFGKTNVPVLLADWQSFNPVYGTTNNPWRLSATPGGSSGGSAAALAAGLSGLEFGSDIGASIRNPAHYCGVYGHKPTFNLISAQGQTLDGNVGGSDIAVVGPLARSAADLALAVKLTAGPNPVDATGWQLKLAAPRFKKPSELRIAVMTDTPSAPVDDAVQAPILALAKALGKLGAKVSYKARPAIDAGKAHDTYIELLRFATAGRMSDDQLERFIKRSKRQKASDNDYQSLMIRGNTMLPRHWHQLNETRHRMRLAWAEFFQEWDVLLCPAAATAAFEQNQKGERFERMIPVNGKPQPSTTQMFWAGFSGMAYLPSTVAPIGLTSDGLPTGVQIVGPQWGDLSTIAVAALIEKHFYRFTPPPGY